MHKLAFVEPVIETFTADELVVETAYTGFKGNST